MEQTSTNASWKQIRTLFRAGSLCGLTDRQLLDRFVARDADEAYAEAAFEVLVMRHGPMVQRLCRSLINDHHDADDAFQATFLVLARRAASIRDREAVASWLYGVVVRVAARARTEVRRRRLLERIVAQRARHEAIEESEGALDLMPELYEEVARLPEHYRAPIILCYLEGQSHEEAAEILRCGLRTLQTRLERGKAKLRLRLTRRGFAPGIGLLTAGLAGGEHPAAAAVVMAASGMLPAGLTESTARRAVQFATARPAGASAAALRLAQGVLQTLFWNRLSHVAGVAMAMTFVGLAAAVQDITKSGDAVTIRVLDDQGRPISGADVWMQVSFHDNATGEKTEEPTGHGTTDGQGRYVMPIHERRRPTPNDRRFGLMALVWAHAPGHEMATANAWKALYREVHSVDLTLGTATNTEFLVLDPARKPVAGATVEPRGVKTPINLVYSLPPKFVLPILQAVTGADGRARLPALRFETFRSVQIATATFGIQHQWLQEPFNGPPQREIHLRSTGRVIGRVVADQPEWARGVKISITTTSDPDRRDTEGTAEVVSRADGFFVIPSIAEGHARLRITVDPTVPVVPRIPDVEAEVERDAITRVQIRLEKSVRVRGAIRSRKTGEPITRAEILTGRQTEGG